MNGTIQLLTAAAAFVAAAASVWNVWNAHQFSLIKGKVDTPATARGAHVNAAGLHGR